MDQHLSPYPCQSDPEPFFSGEAHRVKLASQACRNCPIVLECRLAGLEGGEFGVWGGLSHNQRVRMGWDARQKEMRRVRNLLAQKRHEEAS